MADTDIRALVESRATDIEGLLAGSGLTLERFKATVFQLWDQDSDLRKCTPNSILSGVMAVADVGLTLTKSLGHAYLVKFGNSAIPIIGAKGLAHLALKSGAALDIRTGVRREGELFKFRPLHPTEPIIHEPLATADGDDAASSTGKVVGYYAVAYLPGGLQRAHYMDRQAVERHRDKYSKAAKDGPWVTAFDEMAMKTQVRYLCKYMRLSGPLAKAVSISDHVEAELGNAEELPPDDLPSAGVTQVESPVRSGQDVGSTPAASSKLKLQPSGSRPIPATAETPAAAGKGTPLANSASPARIGDGEEAKHIKLRWRDKHDGRLDGFSEWIMETYDVEDVSELTIEHAQNAMAAMSRLSTED